MQNYMFLGLKSPYRTVFSLHSVQTALSAFAILAGLVASGSVFLNDLYFWGQSSHYINPYLCLTTFLLAFSPGAWGLAGVIFLLPLSAGLGTQLNAYLGSQFLILPNAGLDLVAGFFLGSALREISKVSDFLGKNRRRDLTAAIKELAPWPIALVIIMITISTAIAISRNVYQSAAATSFKGLLFNLVHFRPIGWHDDYMPISDWIAYALAVAMIILVLRKLKDQENKNQIIFRPIMAGLIIAALMGISQAITGLGLPENLLSFRKDQLGYAVIGFQPDLHAFAGHMLLGAVGLWGYFYSGISKLEKKVVLMTVALCWTGLVLSKSRALLLLALVIMLVWLVWHIWKRQRNVFIPAISTLAALSTIFIVLIFDFSDNLRGVPVLSWLGELANEFKSRDLTSWSLLSGIFGSRFEIWGAAIRMWWEYPLMGVGQGNFYRLSDIAPFSKSHFLILNHGENAHNYFIQTLSEVGILGAIVFGIFLAYPFFKIQNKKSLAAGLMALASLFLGNIFAHSFLVRENLLLASVIYALIYCSFLPSIQPNQREGNLFGYRIHNHNFVKIIMLLLIAIVVFLGGNEVYRSFGRLPFERGRFCYAETNISPDGWTSGSFELPSPRGSSQLSITFYLTKYQLDNLFKVNIQLVNSNLEEKNISQSFSVNKDSFLINFSLPQGSKIESDNVKFLILLNKCFVPRNLGINLDSRRLGLYGLSYEIY